MRSVFMLALCVALLVLAGGCGAAQKTDWSSLVVGAAPEIKAGPCGPELWWSTKIQASDKAEILGHVVAKKPCKEVRDMDVAESEAPK